MPSTGVLKRFYEHQKVMVRLLIRAPLYCTSQGVLVFNMRLETLLWAWRGNGETLKWELPYIIPHRKCLSSTWGLKRFYQYQELVMKLTVRAPLHPALKWVFVFNMRFETVPLMWVVRDNDETLKGSSLPYIALDLKGEVIWNYQNNPPLHENPNFLIFSIFFSLFCILALPVPFSHFWPYAFTLFRRFHSLCN